MEQAILWYGILWALVLLGAAGVTFVVYQFGKWIIKQIFGFTKWETIFDTFDCDCVRR